MTIKILPTSQASMDASVPDNVTTVWPLPHDPKIDIAVVVEIGLKALGITDVPVMKDGSFHTSDLRFKDAQGEWLTRPVITVSRASDVEGRLGIGDIVGVYAKGEEGLVDDDGLTTQADATVVQGRLSDVTIDVTVSDLNSYRADQMYLILKGIMFAAKEEFRRVGYLKIRRVNGQDIQKIEINDPEPGIVYSRTLTYLCEFPDYLIKIEELASLVKQSLTVLPGSSDAAITTALP